MRSSFGLADVNDLNMCSVQEASVSQKKQRAAACLGGAADGKISLRQSAEVCANQDSM